MIKVEFTKGRETKNTWRYDSVEGSAVMGSLYLQKDKVVELGNPEKLTVVVTPE